MGVGENNKLTPPRNRKFGDHQHPFGWCVPRRRIYLLFQSRTLKFGTLSLSRRVLDKLFFLNRKSKAATTSYLPGKMCGSEICPPVSELFLATKEMLGLDGGEEDSTLRLKSLPDEIGNWLVEMVSC
jgi:hypothetical protein